MSLAELIEKHAVKLKFIDGELEKVDALYHSGLLPASETASAYQLGVEHGELFAEARVHRLIIAQLMQIHEEGAK